MIRTIDELQDFETSTLGGVIQAATASLALSGIYTEVFNRLNNDGYSDTMDGLLSNLYGSRSLRKCFPVDSFTADFAETEVKNYLFSKAEFFKKCFLYIDAEYNPVENYAGVEREKTSFSSAEKTTTLTDDMKDRHEKVTDGARTDSTVFGESRDTFKAAKTTEKTTVSKETIDRNTAPYDEDVYSTREQEIREKDGADTFTREMDTPGDVRVINSKTDTFNKGSQNVEKWDYAHTDVHTTKVNPYVDITTREFERRGNIGVLSAGELMQKDSDFWKSFNWLIDSVHDIANIISRGVWAL